MSGIRGRSGPPGNANSFKHGLSALEKRRTSGVLTDQEQSIRSEILDGLLADKGGRAQTSTAMRILAEVIASDVALLVSINQAIENVVRRNTKARDNPRALAQLDQYKRPLVNSLTSNITKFGLDRVARGESLEEILAESADDETAGDSSQESQGAFESEDNG